MLRRDTEHPVEVTTTIDVVIDWDTLLGLRDRPAELAGYGPIPADTARALAADATFRRLVTDPVTGYLLDHGHRLYRTPAPLARYLRARWRTCTAPGCPKPAVACDLDHRIPHARGGRTCAHNLAPLCRRHHRMKTHHHWRYRRNPDGSHTWTSPHGRTADTRPYRYHDPTHDPYPDSPEAS